MKKYILIIFAIAFAILPTSCSEDFLEEVPTEDVAESSATATTGNLFLIINGIHRSLYIRYGAQGRTGISSLMIMNEVLGEDVVHNARGLNWFISASGWNDHTSATNANDLFPFRTYYRIIKNANIIIEGAEGAEGPADERNAALGQALAYRAWAHFQMVQLYGERYEQGGNNSQPGVPLRLTPDNDPLPRASVEEVYAQVNEDLDLAINLLEGYTRPNNSHLDQSVAQGIKARVNLVQQNYGVAAEFANEARQGYDLMSHEEYFSSFNDYENREWMWGSHIVEDQSDTFGNFGAYFSRNFSSTSIRQNPPSMFAPLYDEIADTDIRKELWDPTGEHNNLPSGVGLPSNFSRYPYTNQKFIAAGNGDSRMDTPYMRAAEMYLIEAEALSYIDEDAARDVLYEFASNRDPEYTLSTNSGEDLREEVYVQRRVELWGEGFRFYDLKRLNLPLDRSGGNHNANLVSDVFFVPADDNRWQWLIPQDALNANPLLDQNPL